ncbi:MAG: DUF2203 domain-containing protein [Bryobacteraceae bacterium]
MQKYFTLQTARALLPRVRRWMEAATAARRQMEGIQKEVAGWAARAQMLGGAAIDFTLAGQWQSRARSAAEGLRTAMAELEAVGVEVKDLDLGLVDFPALYRGREVLLCWRLGEDDIGWWHGMEEGFRGRKPVDAEFEANLDGSVPGV